MRFDFAVIVNVFVAGLIDKSCNTVLGEPLYGGIHLYYFIRGKVAAVRSGVSNIAALVECLRGSKDICRGQSLIRFASKALQVAHGKELAGIDCFAFCLNAGDRSPCLIERICQCLCFCLVPFFESAFTGKFNDFPVRFFFTCYSRVRLRYKLFDSLFALNDMLDDGAHAAPDTNKALCLDRSIPCKFNTQEPVHLAAGLGRGRERRVVFVRLCRFKCLLDGFISRVRQPKPINGFLGFETVFDDFIDKPLSFSVRVTGVVNHIYIFPVHKRIKRSNQTFDIIFSLKLEIPVIRKKRQAVHRPRMSLFRVIIREVRIKVNEFIKMSDRGCYNVIVAFQPCVAVFPLSRKFFILPPRDGGNNTSSQ